VPAPLVLARVLQKNLWSSVLGHARKVAREVYCCMHGPVFEAVNVFFMMILHFSNATFVDVMA
jgi:hypothetical protein